MGKLTYLTIHNSFTPSEMDVTKKHLYKWHFIENGWDRYGYTDFIKRDGRIVNLTRHNEDNWITNNEMTWGAKGFNSVSRHICLEGGKLKGNKSPKKLLDFFHLFTFQQYLTLQDYLKDFLFQHHKEGVKIGGHNQFTDKKLCPGFDTVEYLPMFGVPDEFILKKYMG